MDVLFNLDRRAGLGALDILEYAIDQRQARAKRKDSQDGSMSISEICDVDVQAQMEEWLEERAAGDQAQSTEKVYRAPAQVAGLE